jgi:SAM-dependent methyltransferase
LPTKILANPVTRYLKMRRVTALSFVKFAFRLMPDGVRKGLSHWALRKLLEIDRALYRYLSFLAISAAGGLHPKHRLTGYHTFFTERVGPHERVLDVGCGNGALTNDIAQVTAGQVLGIDLSAKNIAQAEANYRRSNLSFLVGDAARDLPPAGPFDTLVLSNLWEHIEDRVEFMRRLLEASGAGKVLIRVPMFEREWLVPLKKELGLEWRLDSDHHIEYTEAQLRQEIEASGLVVEEMVVRWGEFWCRCAVNRQLFVS